MFLGSVVLVCLVLLVLALLVLKLFGKGATQQWPFYVRQLQSPPEQVFYFRLIEALPGFVVLAQVQLSRILGVKKGFRFSEWNNRINRMSVDFVVCSKDFKPVAAIELDDRTHLRQDRIKADQKKDKALRDAGLPIFRWNVSEMPSVEDISSKFDFLVREAIQRDLSKRRK